MSSMPKSENKPTREETVAHLTLALADAVVELLGEAFGNEDEEMIVMRLGIGYRAKELRALING